MASCDRYYYQSAKRDKINWWNSIPLFKLKYVFNFFSLLFLDLSHRRHFEIFVVFCTVTWTVSNETCLWCWSPARVEQVSNDFNQCDLSAAILTAFANWRYIFIAAEGSLLSSHYDPEKWEWILTFGCEIYESLKICEIWQIKPERKK